MIKTDIIDAPKSKPPPPEVSPDYQAALQLAQNPTLAAPLNVAQQAAAQTSYEKALLGGALITARNYPGSGNLPVEFEQAVQAYDAARDKLAEAEEQGKVAGNSILAKISNTLESVKEFGAELPEKIGSFTPPGRILGGSSKVWAPYAAEIGTLLGAGINSAVSPFATAAKSWATGEPAKWEDYVLPGYQLLAAPLKGFGAAGASVAENWFGVKGASDREKQAVEGIEAAVEGVVHKAARRVPGDKLIGDIDTTLVTAVPFVAGGEAAGAYGLSASAKALMAAGAGVGGWWTSHVMRKAATDTAAYTKEAADWTKAYAQSEENWYQWSKANPAVTNITVTPEPEPVVPLSAEGDTSMAGGGASMMMEKKRKKKRKDSKEKPAARHLPPREYKKHIELRQGRVSPEQVREIRTSLSTAERPSPSQSMGGGKRG